MKTAFDNTHAMSAWLSPSGPSAKSAEHHFEMPANSAEFARGITNELFGKGPQLRQQQLFGGRHTFPAQHVLGLPHVEMPGQIGVTTTADSAVIAAKKDIGVYKAAPQRRKRGGSLVAPTQMLWNAQKTPPYNPMARVGQEEKVNKMITQWESHADTEPAGSYSDY